MSSAPPSSVFTLTSALSLAGILLVCFIVYVGSKVFLPKTARWQDGYTFVWLVCIPARVLYALDRKLTNILSRHSTCSYTSHMKAPSSASPPFGIESTPAPAFGRTVSGPFLSLLHPTNILTVRISKNTRREYVAPDSRSGIFNPGIVPTEITMVFCAGPLACCFLAQLAKQDHLALGLDEKIPFLLNSF